MQQTAKLGRPVPSAAGLGGVEIAGVMDDPSVGDAEAAGTDDELLDFADQDGYAGQDEYAGEDDAAGEPGPRDLKEIEEAHGYRGVTACAVAGISYRRLDYWARTGLVVPSIRDASGSGTQRLYSFRDIVLLKVVKRLLDAGVSLQNIRKAIATLRRWGETELATMTLISDGTTVYECRSAEEVVDLLQGGQGVFGIAISGAFKEIQGSLAKLPSPSNVEAAATAAEPQPGGVASAVDELAARRARRRAG